MYLQVRDVNGTATYFYEYRVNRSEPVERAVERFTRQLRRRGVCDDRIAEAAGKPRVSHATRFFYPVSFSRSEI